jgi:hypothetical protein
VGEGANLTITSDSCIIHTLHFYAARADAPKAAVTQQGAIREGYPENHQSNSAVAPSLVGQVPKISGNAGLHNIITLAHISNHQNDF